MKTILLLGAGLVARPLVRYLLDQNDINLVIASKPAEGARSMVAGHPHGRVYEIDVLDQAELTPFIQDADLVVSLLPSVLHVKIARLCLAMGKHLITASYTSEEMAALDEEAKKREVLFLNEIGLDPGIDHMSAMKIIKDVKRQGGRVLSFESCCGGLPAPETNDNPFGYKFSWSPRGVLLAGKNSARYRKGGKVINVAGKELFQHHWKKSVDQLDELEVYPNRDSLVYEKEYGLVEAEMFFRGTFRYPGWCETLEKLVALGYVNEAEDKSFTGMSFAQLTAVLIGLKGSQASRKDAAAFLNLPAESPILNRLEWLGLFSDEPVPGVRPAPIDILTERMLAKMAYRPGERDMVVLQHDFIVDYGGRQEHICSLLLDYGQVDGDSSMARTVGLPTAIAANLIVHEKVKARGVKIPTDKEIFAPVLQELEALGISMQETRTRLE